MITTVSSTVPWGLKALAVEVEVDIALGIPQLTIVGLPDQAVKESKDRVRSAIKNSGFEFPLKKVTVNLAPADLKKEGPAFDLPIALAILASESYIDRDSLRNYVAMGELGLDGRIRGTKGAIQSALLAQSAEKKFLFPLDNFRELALLEMTNGAEFIPLNTLKEAVDYLKEGCFSHVCPPPREALAFPETHWDLKDIKGQRAAKRALEIAVSGGHNLLFLGPPGGGKTMLARRIPSILPDLEKKEALEIAMIYSLSDETEKTFYSFSERPFRSPHHTLSTASLIGGGAVPKPGEITLAHRGVLFLDELSEFKKDALESLRTPLEDKKILVSRVNSTVEYPCAFLLVAASNPCPCGYLTSRFRGCRCTLAHVEQYRKRLSGPFLDRIDIQIEVPEVGWEDLRSEKEEEASEIVRARVEKTREIQRKRFQKYSFLTNGEMNEKAVKLFCSLEERGEDLLRQALKELGLSARAYSRILKIARTIADMEYSENIEPNHIREAIQYRVLDRQSIHV